MNLPQFYIDDIIKTALAEDINYIDCTSDLLIDPSQTSDAVFVAKSDGVLCGFDVALRVFELLGGKFSGGGGHKTDGHELKCGDIIGNLHWQTLALLKGERTALNILQHLSGIATATRKAVKLIEGTGAAVAETRKTLPGLRALQKYAVMTGGGKNHRFNLSDGVMIKDNHIDAAGCITDAVNKLREKLGHMVKIEVETRTLEEVREALDAKADVIMLDNMDIETMKKAVAFVNKRAITEASGNITLENIHGIAEMGIDIISMGALTHSVKALDISMKIKI